MRRASNISSRVTHQALPWAERWREDDKDRDGGLARDRRDRGDREGDRGRGREGGRGPSEERDLEQGRERHGPHARSRSPGRDWERRKREEEERERERKEKEEGEKEREPGPEDVMLAVPFPPDADVEFLISRVARYVAKDGAPLEERLKVSECQNPMFRFLWEEATPEGVFYRWRVFSLLMGDSETYWREKPFQMTTTGPFWVPPPIPAEWRKMKKKKEEEAGEEVVEEEQAREGKRFVLERQQGAAVPRRRSRSRGRE